MPDLARRASLRWLQGGLARLEALTLQRCGASREAIARLKAAWGDRRGLTATP